MKSRHLVPFLLFSLTTVCSNAAAIEPLPFCASQVVVSTPANDNLPDMRSSEGVLEGRKLRIQQLLRKIESMPTAEALSEKILEEDKEIPWHVEHRGGTASHIAMNNLTAAVMELALYAPKKALTIPLDQIDMGTLHDFARLHDLLNLAHAPLSEPMTESEIIDEAFVLRETFDLLLFAQGYFGKIWYYSDRVDIDKHALPALDVEWPNLLRRIEFLFAKNELLNTWSVRALENVGSRLPKGRSKELFDRLTAASQFRNKAFEQLRRRVDSLQVPGQPRSMVAASVYRRRWEHHGRQLMDWVGNLIDEQKAIKDAITRAQEARAKRSAFKVINEDESVH